ncbi:autotransporter assembly complex protein TamA [Thermaurantiacus sp.]
MTPVPGGVKAWGSRLGCLVGATLLAGPALAQETGAPAPHTLPPIPGPDPALFAPLPPLETLSDIRVSDRVPAAPPDTLKRYRLSVEGLAVTPVRDDYRALSTLWRSQKAAISPLELANRLRGDRTLLADLLAAEGWFRPEIRETIEADGRDGDVTAVRIAVDPGPRYRWREIAIEPVPPEAPELAAEFLLTPGAPIRLAEVTEAEAAYQLRLADAGYPFAELGPRDIVLDDAMATGDYLLTGRLGPRVVFGRVRLEGFQPFSDAHAQRIARFRPGDPFSGALLDDYRRALVATRLFAGSAVTPVATGTVDAQGRAVADLVVTGEAAPRRSLGAQIGYTTDEGIRVEGRWQNRNLWKPEGNFTVRGVVGTIEQRAAAEMRKSNFGRRDRFLLLGGDFSNENLPAYRARSFRLGAAIGRQSTPIWQKRWVWQAGAEFLRTAELDKGGARSGGQGREAFTILALPAQGGYDGTDDLLDPGRGFRVSARLSPEAALQGGTVEAYARLQGDASGYWRLREPLVLAGRVRLASIVGTEASNIAPSRRLYAGGGGSVRGYAFQTLGPRARGPDGTLRPIGGRGLFEASAEARYRLGDFGIVGFLDAGQLEAGPRPLADELRFGIGLGVRYHTGFGPIRLDVARALSRRPDDPPLVLYISIGQAF